MRYSLVIAFLLLFSLGMSYAGQAQEPTSVYDAIEGGKGQAPAEQPSTGSKAPGLDKEESILPSLVKLIVSFAFIIILIFLLLRFWTHKTRAIQTRGPFRLIGGLPLGTNRSMQVVQFGKTIYVLGVGENVQLLQTIQPGEEYDSIISDLDSVSMSATSFDVKRWFQKEEKAEQNWDAIFQAKLQELQGKEESNFNLWTNDQEEKRKP